MTDDLLELEAEFDRMTAELLQAQNAWESRVRAGDDDVGRLLHAASEIEAAKEEIRDLRAALAADAERE